MSAPKTNTPRKRPSARLRVQSSDIRVISSIRRLTTELCRHYIGDGEVASRVGVATHELFENAVKYAGEGGTAGLDVSLTPGEADTQMRVDVRTSNPATDEDITRVERLVDLLGRENLRSSYRSMLQAAVSAPTKFGLGLPRVVAEVEMRISCEAGADDIEIGASLDVPHVPHAAVAQADGPR